MKKFLILILIISSFLVANEKFDRTKEIIITKEVIENKSKNNEILLTDFVKNAINLKENEIIKIAQKEFKANKLEEKTENEINYKEIDLTNEKKEIITFKLGFLNEKLVSKEINFKNNVLTLNYFLDKKDNEIKIVETKHKKNEENDIETIKYELNNKNQNQLEKYFENGIFEIRKMILSI